MVQYKAAMNKSGVTGVNTLHKCCNKICVVLYGTRYNYIYKRQEKHPALKNLLQR